jgi:hypothetical protein
MRLDVKLQVRKFEGEMKEFDQRFCSIEIDTPFSVEEVGLARFGTRKECKGNQAADGLSPINPRAYCSPIHLRLTIDPQVSFNPVAPLPAPSVPPDVPNPQSK